MQAITVRLDDDLHEKLRFYRAFMGRSANDLITGLVREFFECQGDAEIAEAIIDRAKRQPREVQRRQGDR